MCDDDGEYDDLPQGEIVPFNTVGQVRDILNGLMSYDKIVVVCDGKTFEVTSLEFDGETLEIHI